MTYITKLHISFCRRIISVVLEPGLRPQICSLSQSEPAILFGVSNIASHCQTIAMHRSNVRINAVS